MYKEINPFAMYMLYAFKPIKILCFKPSLPMPEENDTDLSLLSAHPLKLHICWNMSFLLFKLHVNNFRKINKDIRLLSLKYINYYYNKKENIN